MSSAPALEKVPIGKITGLHGLRGEVRFFSYGGIEEFSWKRVFAARPEEKRAEATEAAKPARGAREAEEMTLKVDAVRRHKGFFLLTFEGFSSRETSGELVGLEVSVPADEIPALKAGEYYHRDLEGLQVWTDKGKNLGTIKRIFSTGGSDVFEVVGPDGEVLIPVTEDTIKAIDLKKRKVTVSLLPGLLPGED